MLRSIWKVEAITEIVPLVFPLLMPTGRCDTVRKLRSKFSSCCTSVNLDSWAINTGGNDATPFLFPRAAFLDKELLCLPWKPVNVDLILGALLLTDYESVRMLIKTYL